VSRDGQRTPRDPLIAAQPYAIAGGKARINASTIGDVEDDNS
jgi:hypothetical protein